MSLSTLGGVLGDWGPEDAPDLDGTTANNGPQVHGNDIPTNATVSNGQDRWTGWFQGLVNTGASYMLAKDAKQNGMVPATAPNGQPTYAAAGPLRAASIQNPGLLLIGAGVLAALLLTRKG